MKNLITKSLLMLVFAFSIQYLYGQQKGSFHVNFTIVNGARPIAFYVPTDYDPSKTYSLMVCLHGSGQPAASYRDNLCQAWASFIKNTIFACLENTSTVRISNMAGAELYKQDIEPGTTEFHQSTSGFAPGVYIIEAVTGGKAVSEKLVIVK